MEAASVPAYAIVMLFCEVPDNQKLVIIACVAALNGSHEAEQPLANDFGKLTVITVVDADGLVPVVKKMFTPFCAPEIKTVVGPVPAPAP